MKEKYEPLFNTLQLPNGAELKNRFVLAPLTHVSSNVDGTASVEEIEYMGKRSKDVGMAISAASNVTDLGKSFPGQPSVVKDTDIEGLARLSDEMKKNGAKAILQIHHGGVQAQPRLTPNSDSAGPSPMTMRSFDETEAHHSREMTEEEIHETIKAFGESAKRAIDAGFDGVEIHGANHYIIHQFVSPHFNRRMDQWGEDRYSFAMAVADEVLQAKERYAKKDFIVGYRFSPEEPEAPGIDMEITETLIKKLIEKPLDYLHASLGEVHSKTRTGKHEGTKRIALLHKWVDGRMPLIGIGSVFTADEALNAINSGNMELIALGRALLLDHNFAGKIEAGREEDINSVFDPEKEDRYELPGALWEQLYNGFYPLPRLDK